ncbi:winged helix-turn-helix domain-containing tetratricopeptide repeat protein [Hydrogenophaga sp.]|uniref:winged helix-turn-helix domain-containing tetratricopeptide repeat protein n=1 Tax=Hydrogenophaga sp. TaxID=1904254 RepID=UPI00286E7F9C|nr:winged helix-turn-helix domain-containing protein [Hydrogenophaga sp.]
MQVRASHRLRFEEFDLDVGCRTLHRAGRRLDLRPRSFDVLVYLAEAAGRPVGKDEVLAAVWPDVVVGEESLTRCVSDIRQVLGEHGQRIIKTLPRRGYVFAVPVEPVPPSRAADAGPPTPADEAAVPSSSDRAAIGTVAGKAVVPVRRGAAAVALWIGLAAATVAAVALAWWWQQRSAPVAPPMLPRMSIVVLPLASDGGDPAQDRLAAVLTDEITVDLSRIPESFVIARATAESYRGRSVDARQVGHELGVRYVLDGDLVRLGDAARLTLQLVDSESGLTLWADRIDGELPDLSALYRRVTGTVARSLDLRLQEVETSRARARPPADAQDLLLQARWLLLQFNRMTPDSLQEARRLLEQVSARDPGSALAIALLAQTYNYDVSQRWLGLRGATREQWLQQADRLSAQAFQLDRTDARIVGVRGTTLALAGRSEQAVELLERQIGLNRNDASAWFWLGYARCTLGRQDEAIAALEQAQRLSPRDPNLNGIFVVTAAAHLYLGRDREALEWAQRSVLERPQHAVAHSWVAAAAANLGETETARAALAEFRQRLPAYTVSAFRDERLCANDLCRAQRERYYAGLAKAGLPE